MNKNQFQIFSNFRQSFKKQTEEWQYELEQKKAFLLLKTIQEKSQKAGNTPEFIVETPIVYNTALDKIGEDDQIKLIVIGDNPGKNEQAAQNRAYLVGQAGKLGAKFFADTPEMKIDFRKNAIILNKTPVHSPKTKDLAYIMAAAKNEQTPAGECILRIFKESQIWLAQQTVMLQHDLYKQAENDDEKPFLWLIGYSELKKAGIFEDYKTTFIQTYKKICADMEKSDRSFSDMLLIFQHFSMNRFTIDLNNFKNKQPELSTKNALIQLGKTHRLEIFGF